MNISMIIQNQMMETDAKLYYTDMDSFVFQMKSEDLARSFVQKFEASNYEVNRPLPIRKARMVIKFMNDGLV